MDSIVETFCKKKENSDILTKHIESYSLRYSVDTGINDINDINDTNDVLYEVGFLIKQEKIPLKETFDLIKNGKLFKNHPNFDHIGKKMKEVDEFMDKPFQVEEGVNICSKCSSKRTLSYNRQTRSGDEGMTVYVFCIDCKFRYTMNS
jgi:DNA-directed RNA polymerase subunit M/transcription elongation factor TFIIS